jgi:methylamine--corrinoid protein Co-methyltransferase
MASTENFLRVLDKAHTGPICTAKDWNLKVLPEKVSQKLRAYRLEGTCDTENPINTDDELADTFFKAGFELALDSGLLCTDTERIIEITEAEIKKALEEAPKEVVFGKGPDATLMKTRIPEDKHPALFGSPMGNLISEDVYIPLHQGIAQVHEVDIFGGSTIPTIFGRRVLAGTPYETLVGRYQAQLTREALWRAGRPGMASRAVATSPTAYGQLGGFGTAGGFDPEVDIASILTPSELMTNYEILHKVANAVICGARTRIQSASIIGGYLGSPEAAPLAQIACSILILTLFRADIIGGTLIDARYGGDCGRHGMWAESIHGQALSRNTDLLARHTVNQTAGPCTEMILYESAVGLLNLSTSGLSFYQGPRSGGGKHADHLTPLECKFCGEILKKSAGMTRKQANDIAKVLIPKYEGDLHEPPKGKRFQDCYDIDKLEPSKEWLGIYHKVTQEVADLGVPLDYPAKLTSKNDR